MIVNILMSSEHLILLGLFKVKIHLTMIFIEKLIIMVMKVLTIGGDLKMK